MTTLRNAFIHLRFPFSLFLLPVFLLALTLVDVEMRRHTLLLFAVLHILVYPSSNAFNSLQDSDKGSIGGLKNPPKAPKLLIPVTIIFDAAALLISYSISRGLFFMMLLYIIASRLYSYRKIRIKKYAILSYLLVISMQGGLVFIMTAYTAKRWAILNLLGSPEMLLGALSAVLLIAAGYPITQIYQHRQDKADGVNTISMMLDKFGTLVLSAILFVVFGATLAALYQPEWEYVLLFVLIAAPAGIYLISWMLRVMNNPREADYDNTMRMNYISTLSLNAYFIVVLLLQYTT
jgi:1,4-dihydroxy-2-naphthoate octaprenyltransferase